MPGVPLEGREPHAAETAIVPAPAYPPEEPFVFPPIVDFSLPGVLIPPLIPGEPPCNPEEEECEPPPPPPPPPTDVPEPGTLFILIIGAAALWLGTRSLRPAKVTAKDPSRRRD